jgi:hypothetical protein
MEGILLWRLVVVLQACWRVLGEAWGDAENDSRAQRNTEKVDPSTNRRRSVKRMTILRLMMLRPLVGMDS